MSQQPRHILLLFLLCTFLTLIHTAGHISAIQTNIDYLNYEYAKNFELIFKLEHELPSTGCMKIRVPFLIDDGTSLKFFYYFINYLIILDAGTGM